MTIRVHATRGEYEQATGEPWFTTARVSGGALHVMPLAALRESGVLDRAVRREVGRAAVEPALARRPLWVSVGTSLYFADPPSISDGRSAVSDQLSRGACPSDAELSQPVSIGAMAAAFARAKACVAKQIAAGRSWREIR